MKVSYKREMNHNYLMIETEYRDSSYEARMMVNNFIEGLLKFRIKKVDTYCYFCYEITSRQPLVRLLESRNLGVEELRMLIVTMARTLNRMEEYLLNESQILVQPEFIYVEPDLFQVEFCLIPGREGNFPQEFSKFLEYLLGKVDYQDQDCVVLAYGLYRESLKDNYGMEDLLRFLGNVLPVTSEEEQEHKGEEAPAALVIDRNVEFANVAVGAEILEKDTWYRRIKRWFLECVRGRKESGSEKRKSREKEPEVLPWQMVFDDGPEERREEFKEGRGSVAGKEDLEGEAEEEIWQPVPAMAAESPNTMLLAERKEHIQARRLMSLEADEPDICIAYYPFIIGKQENLVDYILNKDTVSRLHLRIDEKEGVYYITDLNSTNGTVVAGQLLENNEVVQVKTGDEVVIAGMRFHFA